MRKRYKQVTLLLLILSPALLTAGSAKKTHKTADSKGEITQGVLHVLWREPADISSRNLFYGPGGKQHEPHAPFTFVEEDLDGSNVKFVVRDRDNIKWKVKLGPEAKPETAATRMVWAVGYQANEDYFVPSLQVNGMPAHLHRKQAKKYLTPDGIIHDARLKREDMKKVDVWEWKHNPYYGTREFDGLRVMMALLNNWDLKDENNAVYQEKENGELRYEVSDLGATFGTNGLVRGWSKSRGNLESYQKSKFIKHTDAATVEFATPRRSALIAMVNPPQFIMRLKLRWIGKNIPREDARWMGQLLAKLSPNQIRDAFRSAGFSPSEVDGFVAIVQSRIVALNDL